MSLQYKFKKERLDDGTFVSRPRILVLLKGINTSIQVPALIDSGCDVTVIPQSIAQAIGLKMEGEKSRLYAYRESTEVLKSKATLVFVGKAARESIVLEVPVLIALSTEDDEEIDITLGVNSIFDAFDITFMKSRNRIIMKKVSSFLGFNF